MTSDVHKKSMEEHRNFLAKYKGDDAERHRVIGRMVKDLEVAQQELRKVSEDLEREKFAHKEPKERNSHPNTSTSNSGFVVVLLDADADDYIFQAKFLNKNEQGGKEAADELFARVCEYVKSLNIDQGVLEVVVRAFANLKDLRTACVKHGKMILDASITLFAHGFNHRRPLFDFVDVGKGKEQADNKIRQNLEFYLNIHQCRHIILGVCHDTGYLPVLNKFASDSSSRGRITLLQQGALNPKMRQLGFTRPPLQINSVFSPVVKPAKGKASVSADTGRSAVPHMQAAADGSSQNVAAPVGAGFGTLKNARAFTERLLPSYDKNGTRIDAPLEVDADDPCVKHFQKAGLCYYYYLRGECDGKCSRGHGYPALSPREFDCLWFLARGGNCYAGGRNASCKDPKCVYRHSGKAQGSVLEMGPPHEYRQQGVACSSKVRASANERPVLEMTGTDSQERRNAALDSRAPIQAEGSAPSSAGTKAIEQRKSICDAERTDVRPGRSVIEPNRPYSQQQQIELSNIEAIKGDRDGSAADLALSREHDRQNSGETEGTDVETEWSLANLARSLAWL